MHDSEATDDDDINGFWFWIRPYYNGVVWKDEWQLLNQSIITSISTAPDATYKSMIKIVGGEDNDITDNMLIGWTIFNKTKATIFKSNN